MSADIFARVAIAIGESFALSIVLKATVVLGLTMVAVAFARNARASIRHLVVASAFGVLLMLPVAAAVLPPRSVEIPTAPRGRPTSFLISTDASDSVQPITMSTGASPRPERLAAASVGTLIFAIWLAGVVSFLYPVMRGLWRLRHLRRQSVAWSGNEAVTRTLSRDLCMRRDVDLRLCDELSAPATCGFAHPAILFPTDAQAWNDTHVRQAVVHELEHVRRADWIVQLLTRMVCAVYWFHPFVWIAWRRLCLEAEHACDDAVLQDGDGIPYAQQLVALARRLSASSTQPILSMADRRDLSARVSAVLRTSQARGRVGMRRATVIVTVAVVMATAISPVRAVGGVTRSASGQAPTAAADARLAFDVASVKPDATPGPAFARVTPVGIDYGSLTLRAIVSYAYDVKWPSISSPDARIIALLDRGTYTITAKADHEVTNAQLMNMLQTLLADRFKLVARREPRVEPVYRLVASATGPRLFESQGDGMPMFAPVAKGGGEGRNMPMTEFVKYLTGHMGRVVLDETGLKGRYDFTLTLDGVLGLDAARATVASSANPEETKVAVAAAMNDWSSSSIFTDIEKQLGLKLEAGRGSVEHLIIDRLERPMTD